MGDNIFEIQNLSVDVFDMARKPIIGAAPRLEILKDITFNIQHRDVIGIVGGSGSGKSTLGRAMLRLIEPNALEGTGNTGLALDNCIDPYSPFNFSPANQITSHVHV